MPERTRSSINLVQYLKVQHRVFLEQITSLEELRNSKHFRNKSILRYFVFFIAKTIEKHAKLEEKLLFPKLVPALGPEMKRVRALEFEHGAIRKILAVLNKAKNPNTVLLETAKFEAVLRDHIAKEEKVLFPLAEHLIGENRLRSMVKKEKLMDGAKIFSLKSRRKQ